MLIFSHLLTFSSSHFLTLSPSDLLIFSPSYFLNFYLLISVIFPVNPQSEFRNPQSKGLVPSQQSGHKVAININN